MTVTSSKLQPLNTNIMQEQYATKSACGWKHSKRVYAKKMYSYGTLETCSSPKTKKCCKQMHSICFKHAQNWSNGTSWLPFSTNWPGIIRFETTFFAHKMFLCWNRLAMHRHYGSDRLYEANRRQKIAINRVFASLAVGPVDAEGIANRPMEAAASIYVGRNVRQVGNTKGTNIKQTCRFVTLLMHVLDHPWSIDSGSL